MSLVKAIVEHMLKKHDKKTWPLSDEVFFDAFDTELEECWDEVITEASQIVAKIKGANVPFVVRAAEDETDDSSDDEDEDDLDDEDELEDEDEDEDEDE